MDDKLFDEKYSLYSNLIFKLSMTYLGNKSDAEDIVQEVFIKLFTNTESFKTPEHERFWIIRVTINMCKNHLGTFWHKNIVPLDSIQEQSEYTEYNNDILDMLYSLPTNYRVALYLFYYENYSIEEISKILKVSKSAVKMRLKRGKEKLKLDLEENGYAKERFYPCDR